MQFVQCNFSQAMKCLLVKEKTHFTTMEGNIEYIFDIFDYLLGGIHLLGSQNFRDFGPPPPLVHNMG